MSHIIGINNNTIQITDLLKCFMKFEDVFRITPSRYMKELQMTVEERLNFLNDRSRKQRIGRQNKLWAIPDIVVFQNFETHVKYSTVISFMHQKQNPVRIKVFEDLSPCFRLKELPGTVYSKLAPGTPHKMTLDFYSEEHRDFSSCIRFEADEDVIYLPIVALAPRSIIIFPDVIELSETVVNIASDKKVFMRNLGKSAVVFKLKAESPFTVCPRTGIMEPNEVLDVMISYKTFRAERNISEVVINFEGVDLYAKLMCEAKNCEVYIDKTILYFEDTFLNLKRCISMNLVNKSEYAMKYQWKKFKTKYKDIEECKEFRAKLEGLNEYELLRNIQEENPNITDADLHKTFLQRIYEDELTEFDSTDQFLFHSSNFRFVETSGVVGPHSIANIQVVFCPDSAERYEVVAYLDVTGRETRQPLKMMGTGLGPEITLNFKVLDVENLYLCAKHQYEIVAKNEGNIPGTLTYCHRNMDFGGSMSCSPNEVFINPGKCEKMVLEFSSTMQGKFLENLHFKIAESGEYIGCVFQGNVVCPLLSYDIQEIDFGIVAFGFAVEKEISIRNSTEVPIEFRICVVNDGTHEAITWVNFSRSHDAKSISSTPKEFSIYPDEATVAGNSSVTIKLTLVPNKARRQSTFLHTYMWGSRKHYAALPIYYNCIVPIVECSPPRLDIRYCFINCPYDRMFTLKNISEVPGYLLYNEMHDDDGLSCTLSLTESYIEPGEEITIHLEIKGLQLGLHMNPLNFTVFGKPPMNLCKLTCDVQGPVICVHPEEIKFGSVSLLKWHSRKLHVMNDSPVSAYISIYVANPTFHINPNEFKLEASEKLEVDVSIYLTSVAKYSSTLILNIVNSMDPLKVHVSAFGVGSCILFEPILEPVYDLGTLMTHNNFKMPFKMTNMGKDIQKLYFSRVNDLKTMRDDTPVIKGYPFIIEPNQYDFMEKEQKTGYIEVYYTSAGPAELKYSCYSIDKKTKFTKISEVKIFAHFEDPVLVLSKSSIHFRMDVTVDKTDSYLQEIYTVTNDSYLALDIYVTLNPPFYLLEENGERTTLLNVNLASRKQLSFYVEFEPPGGVKKCFVFTGAMKIGFKLHPKIFSVPLSGELNYPTLLIYPESIKNQHIPPMAHASKELIIKNVSPLPVEYMYAWKVTSYDIEKLSTPTLSPASVKESFTWDLNRFENIPNLADEENKQVLNHLIESIGPSENKLPHLQTIYEVLLGNVKFPYLHSDNMKKLSNLCSSFLCPVIQNGFNSEQNLLRILEDMDESKEDINEAMLNVSPYQGCLQPYECSLVNFYMRPPLHTYLKATVQCRILGGAIENTDISAICDRISFDIESMEVYFGNRLFSEALEEQIKLTNTGHVGFEYAILDDTNIARPKIALETASGLLTVTPNMGSLEPDETVILQVKYYPGVTGEFNEAFIIEIGYLEPLSIRVHGTAVYSQLYIMLPRPSLFEAAETFMCYRAIGFLTKDLNYIHYNMKAVYINDRLDEITKTILEKEDWVVVEHNDVNIPSLVDIDMAIERMIGYEYLQNNLQLWSERGSNRKKNTIIPNYVVPTYELFFGNVRRDGLYEESVAIYNYGPGMSTIKLLILDRKSIETKGFNVTLDDTKIKLKEFINLNVKFKPDVKGADFSIPYISELIYIEVNQGARIPVTLSASVGIPTTELSDQCVDFCGVLMGNCKRKILCLFNVGFVDAKWSCSIDSTIFFVRKKEGVLAAGESEQLQVYFEPKRKGPTQGILTFHIEGSAEDLTAYLNGYGREPTFIIKDRVVEFEPVLQYSPPLEESFIIQNASSFPTEIFMSDYDRQIALHDRICSVFWREKNAKKVYIANSLFSSTPSDIYRYIYKELLLDRLRREKSFTEVMILSKTDVRGSSDSVERLLDTLELRVDSSIAKKRPSQDIFMDPDVENDKPALERKTKIIVFHGNKYTDFAKAANYTSRILQIPRFTLDSMIIDILVENKTPFTKEVNQILDDAYLMKVDSEDCLCKESYIEDNTEELWRKLNVILSSDPPHKSKTKLQKQDGKERTEKGEQLSVTSSRISKKTFSTTDILQGIPEEMIVQILSDKIDELDKMLLESLDSVFMPNPQIALKVLLKAARDITCVYFVFFTCTLEEHTALLNEEELMNAAKENNSKQILRKKLLEIDDYSILTEEEQDVLSEIQEERRNKNSEKRTELRARIQDDLTKEGRNREANDLKNFWTYLDSSSVRLPPSNPKQHSKPMKSPDSHAPHSSIAPTKEFKDTKDSKSVNEMKLIERQKDVPPIDNTTFYFYQYDIILSEMMFLLEHWNRKELELKTNIPNFASMMSVNKKDTKGTTKEFAKKAIRTKSRIAYAPSMDNIHENVIKTSFDADVGYPVWLINNAHKKRSWDVIEAIIGLLKKMITINCLSPSNKICKEREVIYTVLTKPTSRRWKEKLDVFDLIKCDNKSEVIESPGTTQPENDDDTSKYSFILNTASKKKYKQKRKLTLTPTPSEIEQTSVIPVRFLLEPGQIQEICVLFKPLYCGSFKYSYNFEIVGTYHKEKVVVKASCDYPRIDTSPFTLFPHHVQNIDSKTMFLNGVYVISQQTLDFGTILLIPNHLLEMKSCISMLNTSMMTCFISLCYKNETHIFHCDEEHCTIEVKPGRQHVLSIYAKPPSEGLFKETMLISITNNPRVQEINLSCFACPLKFEVFPKNVNFNKVIMGKTESEKITFKNYTAVMIYFEFDVNIASEFKISSYNGYLDPCSTFEVMVTFVPLDIGDRKESLTLKIFDKEKQYPHPIHTEVLTLSAEVATFPLEYATSINLGLVKGKVSHFFPFTITNTGKYDVKVLLNKQDQRGNNVECGEYFKMKHMEYVVEGNSKYSNTCKFTCDKELTFIDCPVVHVTILDNYRNSAIDHFTFKASAKVALSKFELCPHGEYFFGYQNVNSTRSSMLTLKNTGSFEFKYTIKTPNMIEEQSVRKYSKNANQLEDGEKLSSLLSISKPDSPHTEAKSVDRLTRSTMDSKMRKKSKAKSVADMLPEIKTETFSISPSNGVVLPDQSVTINIESRPTECQKYKETIVFFVSEPNFEDRRGRILNLHVEGAEPCLDFSDNTFMFPQQYVVKNIENLPHIGENIVFETSNNLLHFGKITINNSVSTRFRVPNTGHVTATVLYDIKEKDCCFSVRSRVIDIAPYKFEFNSIEFSPRTIGVWTGTLEVKCSDLNYTIKMIGEACMPTIEIIEPNDMASGEKAQLCFGPIPIETYCERSVVLMNNGRVPCKVVVEIVDDPEWFLSISLRSKSDKNGEDFEENVKKHSDMLELKVGEKAEITLEFEASAATCLDADLKIFVMNNCFDVWKLHLHAFAFDLPVYIEDLPVHILESKVVAYSINFGAVVKNELNKCKFKIKNVSQFSFKFEFRHIQELIFSPRVGHLYGGTEKTIVAAFRTRCHIFLKDMEVLLTVARIDILAGHAPPLPWDERQNTNIAIFKSPTTEDSNENDEIPSLGNAIFETNEPPFNIVGEPSVIPLVLNAQCDYANYFCEHRELYFPSTSLYTVSSQVFRVENRSKANLEINWTISDPLEIQEIPTAPKPSLFEKMQLSEPELPTIKPDVDDVEVFTIEPEICTIPPEAEHKFEISFIPIENKIHEYCLKANMKNLDPETADLEIALKGESQIFPYKLNSTHMEDFHNSDHRFKSYCGLPTDDNTKILNFLSLGVGSECNRTLYITNNTDSPFSFVWRNARTDHDQSFFHCEFNKGHILPGKTTKTNFVFIPQRLGTFTNSFQFEPFESYIPKSSLLLQGICRNPKVFFESAFLTLGVVLLNDMVEKEIILRNDEDLKIHYSFKKQSLFSDNQQVLKISPMSGLMDSKSRISVRVTIKTTKEGDAIFSPKCIIQYMTEPIHFNVLMNVVDISSEMLYYGRELNRLKLKPNEPFTINLGVIVPHKREELKFELKNSSRVGFYYSWSVEDKQFKTRITFNRKEGYLKSSEIIMFTASLVAIRKCLLKNIILKLKILYGPTYIIRVEASTQKPKYTFSFLNYNFGKCLIQEEATKFYHTVLEFKNNNEWPVILEYGKSNNEEFLIDFKSAEVGSKESRSIDIFFSPRLQQIYEAIVHFFVHSNKTMIKLSGEGVPLVLEVLNLKETFLDFGKVRVGKCVQKSVKILNAGESCIDVFFGIPPKLPFNKKKMEKAEVEFSVESSKKISIVEETPPESKQSVKKKGKLGDNSPLVKAGSKDEKKVSDKDNRSAYSKEERSILKTTSRERDLAKKRLSVTYSKSFIMKSLEKLHTDSEMWILTTREELNKFLVNSIKVFPNSFIRLPPNKIVDVVVKFNPKEGRGQFQSNIFYQVQNSRGPILTITGWAVHAGYKLNKEIINFGNVVVGYNSEESIVLINEGFIGGKFHWYLEKSSSYVSFLGGDGYSPPNSKVTTNIIFKPGHVQCVFKFKAYCEIENYPKRLELILTGGSMNLPPPVDTIYFVSAAREEAIQQIEFKNETKETWKSEPVFTGTYFSGENVLTVPKESTVMYQVTYSPMKLNPSQHKGTLFFPLANGLNRLYALEGTVLPPNAVSEISREISCKTYYSEILKIENWLGLRQQFKVFTEVFDGPSTKMIYKITSNDHFEVPPYGRRDFKWTIYVVNEGRISFKVTFLNEKTKEYLYYVIVLKISSLEDIIENIEFVTCVRVPAIKKISVSNPLPEAVDYSITSTSPYVFVENSLIVLPYEKYDLSVKYMPVKVESSSAVLTISNPAVGTYRYNLILEAQPSNSEPEVEYRCQFGQCVSQSIPLPRLLQNSDAAAKIMYSSSFEIVKVQVNDKPNVEVSYLPSEVGITRAALQVTSCLGDYTFPLVGECICPEPQGPLTINIGETISIPIFNPFEEDKTFFYNLDNSAFQVKPSEDTIRPKKSMKILLSSSSRRTSKFGSSSSITPKNEALKSSFITGKLTVSCENHDLKWIYYLQCNSCNK